MLKKKKKKEKVFKCPSCETELVKVCVISRCIQYAKIDGSGQITSYGRVEDMDDILKIECLECGYDLTSLITE